MRRTILSSAAAILLAGAAFAEDKALILGNERYEQLGRVSRAENLLNAVKGLEALGFRVQSLRNGRADASRAAIAAFAEDLPDAERIVVALGGQFVTDGQRTWLLTSEAAAPNLLTLGDTAVSVDSLLKVMATAPGQSVLLLALTNQGDVAGPWLRTGLGMLDIPQGVTVLRGDPRDVAGFAAEALVEPGADLMPALKDWNLQPAGYAPRRWTLMPAEPVASAPEIAPTIVDTAAEDALWAGAAALDTVEAYRNYLRRYPDGRYASEAETVIAEILAEPNRDVRKAEDALDLTRDQRRVIQSNLTILDYNTRGIDGIFGPGSRQAIANWQKANGYAQSTFLTEEQINQIAAQAARRSAELEAEAERRRAEETRLDRAYWEETGAKGDEPGLRAYLAKYPDGVFAALAASDLSEIEEEKRRAAEADDRAAWESARNTDTLASYRAYLRVYPDGVFRDEANARIAALTEASADQQALSAAAAAEEALNLTPLTSRLIETRLAQLGLDPGLPDGIFDNNTRRALRNFQRARQLDVTGYLNEATMIRLMAESIGILGR